MKQKRNYSLTAKERKAKRMAEENKKQRKAGAVSGGTTAPVRENAEHAMITAQKRTRRTALIVGGVCMVAVILIVIALIAPVILYVVNPYRGYKDVIARFNLSNGMVLEYVIDEEEYDTAATNFIFLAKNGYFDNTVFYDAQNGWLRFGGYENQPTTGSGSNYRNTNHHKDNTDFCNRFAALPNSRFETPTRKFGYRLHADSKGTEAHRLEQEGVLAFLYSDTSTEFQFSYQEQATNQIISIGSGQTTYELSPTMVGHALNRATIDNIKKIAATGKVNEHISSGYLWRPPTPNVRISSVKVYNLDNSKWRDFDFIKYVRDGNRLSQWIGTV